VSQSAAIFAALLVAFVVFITMRGELTTYIGFFLGGGAAPQPGATAAAPTSGPGSGFTSAGHAIPGASIIAGIQSILGL
jgi:hypothetical protein